MRKTILLATVMFAVASAAVPTDAAILDFALNGSLIDGSQVYGALKIDNSLGRIIGSNVFVSGTSNYHFTSVSFQGAAAYTPNAYGVNLRDTINKQDFDFDLYGSGNGSSLIGITEFGVGLGNLYDLTAKKEGADIKGITRSQGVGSPTMLAFDGRLSDGSTYNGTLGVNIFSGVLTSANIKVSGASNFDFNSIHFQESGGYTPDTYGVNLRNANATQDFDFLLKGTGNGSSLVGVTALTASIGNLFDLKTNTEGPSIVASPVPETGAWLDLILGFGMLGVALRSSKLRRLGRSRRGSRSTPMIGGNGLS